jgi:hypothetical protein
MLHLRFGWRDAQTFRAPTRDVIAITQVADSISALIGEHTKMVGPTSGYLAFGIASGHLREPQNKSNAFTSEVSSDEFSSASFPTRYSNQTLEPRCKHFMRASREGPSTSPAGRRFSGASMYVGVHAVELLDS